MTNSPADNPSGRQSRNGRSTRFAAFLAIAAVVALPLVLPGISPSGSSAAAPASQPAGAGTGAGAAAEAGGEAVAAARKALQANPSDPAASLTVGRFLCFEKGDWTAGLPLLAKGSDTALAEMAAKDLGVADFAIARTVLGHDWWDYAASLSGQAKAEAKVRCRERAAYWYRMTLANPEAELPAGERAELRQRIAEADAEAATFYAKAGKPRPFDPDSVALDRKLLDAADPQDTQPLEPARLSQDKTFEPAGKPPADEPQAVKPQAVKPQAVKPQAVKPLRLEGKISVEGDKPVKLTFAPGLEIRGGTIDLGVRGQAVIKGTAEKPVVFRGVTFFQDLGASLTAENAVFDHCQFHKGGAWFSYHSSKWVFTDCLLYACTFGRLTGVDYGFQIRRCALVSMDLPEIAHNRDQGFDHMTRLRGEWNKIESCDFVDCTVPPTVAWCAEGSNFRRCRFTPGEAFDSAKDLDWSAYVADPVGPGPETAWAEHPAVRGKVKHVQPDRPFEATHLPSVMGGLAPEVRIENGRARLLAPHLKAAVTPPPRPE